MWFAGSRLLMTLIMAFLYFLRSISIINLFYLGHDALKKNLVMVETIFYALVFNCASPGSPLFLVLLALSQSCLLLSLLSNDLATIYTNSYKLYSSVPLNINAMCQIFQTLVPRFMLHFDLSFSEVKYFSFVIIVSKTKSESFYRTSSLFFVRRLSNTRYHIAATT